MYSPLIAQKLVPSSYEHDSLSTGRLLWLFALHIPLGLLLNQFPQVATLHALIILALGTWFVLLDQTPERMIYITGYIVGAEVLWRMTDANVFWEFGKYAIIFLLFLAIFRWRSQLRLPIQPILYLMLLLPAVIPPLFNMSLNGARQQISFNLSGHLLFALAILFFSQIKFTRKNLEYLTLMIAMPVVGTASITLYSFLTKTVEFTQESNSVTSGGFGPNQVSVALGLGALMCWLWVVGTKGLKNKTRWLFFVIPLWFLTQAILTFSRSGILNFIGAATLGTLYLAKEQTKLLKNIFLAVLMIAVAFYFLLPSLNALTKNQMYTRYTDLEITGRKELLRADLKIWQNNFLYGVGAGQAKTARGYYGGKAFAAAHTEYTRMLAEHGALGALALLLMFVFLWQGYRKASPWAKGFVLAFTVWSLLEMTHSAMRIAAISYMLALPLSQFQKDNKNV